MFPVIVTATHDYFPTKDDAYVRTHFKRLSAGPGVLVRLKNSSHMPDELSDHIVPIATMTGRKELNIQHSSVASKCKGCARGNIGRTAVENFSGSVFQRPHVLRMQAYFSNEVPPHHPSDGGERG